MKLMWYCSREQLQSVEDWRQGKRPVFEIRSLLGVIGNWIHADGKKQDIEFRCEPIFDVRNSSTPMRYEVDQTEWARVLGELGFRNIIFHEFPLPSFPPAFSRATELLNDAWSHHREGREDSTVVSCFKGLECLGFNISGARIERTALIEKLLDGEPEDKRKQIEAIWIAIQNFCHLGRHERGSQVTLKHADGELAVVSTTALLKYLAEPRK